MNSFIKHQLRVLTFITQKTYLHTSSRIQTYFPLDNGANKERDEEGPKMVNVSVIGMPNSGKSTLVNSILERRVVSVSKKVHTTRRETVAVANVGNTQMVFLDNPGFITEAQARLYQAEPSLYKDPFSSVQKADVVVLLHDVSDFHYRHQLAPAVVDALKLRNLSATTVLAFNKVDRVKNKIELLDIARALSKSYGLQINRSNPNRRMIENYHKYLNTNIQSSPDTHTDHQSVQSTDAIQFDEVFMLSALVGDGVNDLKNYIISCAKPCPWKHERGFFTDQSINEIVVMCVREKILDNISEEIPYKITPIVESCQQDAHGYTIRVELPCKSKRFASALMGREGKTMKTLAVLTEQSLSETLKCIVTVKIAIVNKKK